MMSPTQLKSFNSNPSCLCLFILSFKHFAALRIHYSTISSCHDIWTIITESDPCMFSCLRQQTLQITKRFDWHCVENIWKCMSSFGQTSNISLGRTFFVICVSYLVIKFYMLYSVKHKHFYLVKKSHIKK